jgi:hypothetical protein
MVGLDAQLSTRFGTLHIEGGGWQLSCQPKNAALNLPRLPAGSPVWSVINQVRLQYRRCCWCVRACTGMTF